MDWKLKMNKIPEEKTKTVCEKLQLERCLECAEGNHNELGFFSREMQTGCYDQEWKRTKLLEYIKEHYSPYYKLITALRFSESPEDLQKRLGK